MFSKEYNKELCMKYPFLIPRNRWSGKRITDGAGFWPGNPEAVPEYDWDHTELDQMPDGWRKAFGEQLCAELKTELEQEKEIVRIITDKNPDQMKMKCCLWTRDAVRQLIKEKYGMLRWYDNGNTKEGYRIIGKYVAISKRTCICCGEPATVIATGWISPFCDKCLPEYGGVKERTIPIDEYYGEMEDEDSIETENEMGG